MNGTLTVMLGGSLELILRPPPPVASGYVLITACFAGFSATAKGDRMAYTMPVGNYCDVKVSYFDQYDNPAPVESVVWSVSPDGSVDLTPDAADFTKCRVTATTGQIGTIQVLATADADLGQGVQELITTLDMTLVAGEAVSGRIDVTGEYQPIPPPGP